jgi:hypothetical protein
MTVWLWLQFLFSRILPNLKGHLWTNRASVVDARLASVCGASLTCHDALLTCSLNRLAYCSHKREERLRETRRLRVSRVPRESVCFTSLSKGRYCFGGTTGIRLASTDLIQSVVICHPGPFSLSQVQVMRVPSAWVRAEGMYSSHLTMLLDPLTA